MMAVIHNRMKRHIINRVKPRIESTYNYQPEKSITGETTPILDDPSDKRKQGKVSTGSHSPLME